VNEEQDLPFWAEELPEPEQPGPALEPPAGGDDYPAPAPLRQAPRARRSPRTWLWAIPTVVLAVACAVLVLQTLAAAATVQALVTRVPQLLLPAQSPNPLGAQLQMIGEEAAQWDFRAARERAERLALPPSLQPPAAGAQDSSDLSLGGPGTVPQVTPQAAQFFREHSDLEQRLIRYADLARALRDQGKDVQSLRDLRDQIFDAAGAGDLSRVSALLDEFAQGLRALGADPDQPGIEQTTAEFRKAFESAQREGRDPSAGVALIRRAEAAAQAGRREEALRLARQALEAMKNAPRMRRAGAPRAMMVRRTGPPPGAAERVLGAVFGLMTQEDKDLYQAHLAIEEAAGVALEQNPDQVREVLAQARDAIVRIHQRRLAFGDSLRTQAAIEGSKPPVVGPPGASVSPPVQVPPPVAEKFAQIIDTIRGMTPEEYHAVRMRVAAKLVGVLTGRGLPGDVRPEAETGAETGPLAMPPGLSAEQRIREKLRAAAAPLRRLKEAGEDTTALEELLRQARQDLYAGKLEEAESKVDQALRELGVLPSPEGLPPLTLERTPPEPAPPGEAPPLRLDE